MSKNCTKTVLWYAETHLHDCYFKLTLSPRHPPPNTDYSAGIWAPELHSINGRWYVYVATEYKHDGNKSHRMYVLGGPPSSSDPSSSFQWEFLGPIRGMPMTQWAIDGTFFSLNGRSYFVYSGWPMNDPSLSDSIQELYIIEMNGPTTAVSAPFLISQPLAPWEKSDRSSINEGPQFLSSPDGSWVGLVYSCAGSWTQDYKMNTLRYIGGDPLNRASWHKSDTPLLEKKHGGPFGPGHGSFISENNQTLAIFHATDRDNEGWENRKARVQKVDWTAEGPKMGWKNEMVPRHDANDGKSQRKEKLRGLLNGVMGMLK
jgi:GH43 family beta-xylosidase